MMETIFSPIQNSILEVLKSWENPIHGEFDAMWNGYGSLLDEIKEKGHAISLYGLKKEMKSLRQKGYVELQPTYDSDYNLCGKGYFINHLAIEN